MNKLKLTVGFCIIALNGASLVLAQSQTSRYGVQPKPTKQDGIDMPWLADAWAQQKVWVSNKSQGSPVYWNTDTATALMNRMSRLARTLLVAGDNGNGIISRYYLPVNTSDGTVPSTNSVSFTVPAPWQQANPNQDKQSPTLYKVTDEELKGVVNECGSNLGTIATQGSTTSGITYIRCTYKDKTDDPNLQGSQYQIYIMCGASDDYLTAKALKKAAGQQYWTTTEYEPSVWDDQKLPFYGYAKWYTCSGDKMTITVGHGDFMSS